VPDESRAMSRAPLLRFAESRRPHGCHARRQTSHDRRQTSALADRRIAIDARRTVTGARRSRVRARLGRPAADERGEGPPFAGCVRRTATEVGLP
jgi:hypothetical protein